MIGYLRAAIEIERLVHHAIQIGDAVVSLDHERFGKLEAVLEQRGEVRLFQLQHGAAERVAERRFGRGIDARRVVDEELRGVGD